jgi:hypothetical protein
MAKRTQAQKIARLEFINDQVVAELQLLDSLLRELGFEEGLESLKVAAKELIEEKKESKGPRFPSS